MSRDSGTRHSASASLAPPRLESRAGTKQDCVAFIRNVVEEAGADGVVVNLSGGLDSTVTATLAVEALGTGNVFGLILPSRTNADENIHDARRVAEELAIDHRVVEIQPLLDLFTQTMTGETREVKRDPLGKSTQRITAPAGKRENYKAASGNAAARLRMMAAYFEANTTSRLVIGTGNRTELLLGYFTKYGDGGVDLLPIGDLYKTQVRELARSLGVRDDIIEKEPTAGLWEGQADEAELGASYEMIDAILARLVDDGKSAAAVADAVGVDIEFVRTYAEMYDRAAHKRQMPPTPATRASEN